MKLKDTHSIEKSQYWDQYKFVGFLNVRGRWHRLDGPAVICSDNINAWWEHGKFIANSLIIEDNDRR